MPQAILSALPLVPLSRGCVSFDWFTCSARCDDARLTSTFVITNIFRTLCKPMRCDSIECGRLPANRSAYYQLASFCSFAFFLSVGPCFPDPDTLIYRVQCRGRRRRHRCNIGDSANQTVAAIGAASGLVNAPRLVPRLVRGRISRIPLHSTYSTFHGPQLIPPTVCAVP